jgi:hypothetical protein
MSCVHLKKLYELCSKEEIKISASDLVRIVCTQCNEHEVCPTMLMENFAEEDDAEEMEEPKKDA